MEEERDWASDTNSKGSHPAIVVVTLHSVELGGRAANTLSDVGT